MPEYAAFCRNCGASMSLEQEPDSEKNNPPSVLEESKQIEKSNESDLKKEASCQSSKIYSISANKPEDNNVADQDSKSDRLAESNIKPPDNQKTDSSLKRLINNIKNIPTLNLLIIIAMSVIAVALIVFVFLLITD